MDSLGLALLRYLLFAAAALVGPGLALQRLAGVAIDAALVLPLGFAAAAGAYLAAAVTGAPWLFPLLIGLLDASLLWRGLGRRAPGDPPLRGCVPAAVALLAVFAATQYGWNRPGTGGEFLLDHMGDHPLHVGITRELVLPWPPQVPGLAGVTLHYHLGADLVRAAGVEPVDSLSRCELTLGAVALVLALRGIAARLGGSPLALRLVPWSLLACDFSFVLALAFGFSWWADLLRGNLLLSLLFANPVVPGLALALGALVALSRLESGEGRGWLFVAAVLALATPFFKVFLGAHLALGLALAAVRGRRRAASALLAGLSLAGVGLLATSPTGGEVEVALAPLDIVRGSLAGLELGERGTGAIVAWTLPWLFLSLGLRVAGVASAAKALVGERAAPAALAGVALSGWPLGLLFTASARDLSGLPLPSATIYFVEQSGAVLWVFAALTLASVAARSGRSGTVVALAAALSLPATAEVIARRAAQRPDVLSPELMGGLRALERVTRPGDIVLQRPGSFRPPLPVIFSGRRVLLETASTYLTQFAPAEELRRRRRALVAFFRAASAEEAGEHAAALGAAAVCLYDAQALSFDERGLLEPVWLASEIRVYRFAAESPGIR
jgi:hypothetical protein